MKPKQTDPAAGKESASRIRNPLMKRIPRELKDDLGKYIVLFVLLVLSISIISGFLVAANSMLTAYHESFEKYTIEDGNFTTENRMNKGQLHRLERAGVQVFDLFFAETVLDTSQTLRFFAPREEVNRVCLMDGEMPSAPGEIALDRMFAENNHMEIGSVIREVPGETAGRSWTVTGLVALSDYSCLFADNADSMFDSLQFGVGILTAEEFDALPQADLTWRYAWLYDAPPADVTEEKKMSEDFLEVLSDTVPLSGFVPRYLNRAIQFTGEDMGSDRSSMMMLLYIIIVIIAFVFAITISSTITREAAVIGTLRATGYTKGELIRHYMTLPLLVTFTACAVGNILGYTRLKDFCAGLYYGSYSLPTYVTLWNGEAFIRTTVLPVILLCVIDLTILGRKLSLSPLRFLRRDLSRRGRKRAIRLPKRLPFFDRFRIRIILQNLPNYLLLLFGILFANILLFFGLFFPSILKHYEAVLPDTMFADYQYILQIPAAASGSDRLDSLVSLLTYSVGVETENGDAEKFTAYTLSIPPEGESKGEDVLIYGLQENSRYLPLGLQHGEVIASGAYREKYLLEEGDTVELREKYDPDTYRLTVTGFYPYDGGLALFMPMDDVNALFDLGEDTFCGYFSSSPITDIDEKYIGQVIDHEALTKISRQLMRSMGGMMGLVDVFAVIIYVFLIYLLTKIIIEKNAQSISMTKILGYTNREISRLYIRATTIMTLLFLAGTLPVCTVVITLLFRVLIQVKMSGWLPLYYDKMIYIEIMALGTAAYLAVAALEYRKIRKIPMNDALKNVE